MADEEAASKEGGVQEGVLHEEHIELAELVEANPRNQELELESELEVSASLLEAEHSAVRRAYSKGSRRNRMCF